MTRSTRFPSQHSTTTASRSSPRCRTPAPGGLPGDTVLVTGSQPSFQERKILVPTVHPVIANDGRILLYEAPSVPTSGDPGSILLLDPSLTSQTVVASMAAGGFTRLGSQPGISDDGKIVVFSGDRGMGPGVFASIDTGGSSRQLVPIAGEGHSDLGFDATDTPLTFQDIDLAQRVGVAYQDLGPSGFDPTDSFVVSFLATPGGAKPSLFTAQKGLWAERVVLDAPLAGVARVSCFTWPVPCPSCRLEIPSTVRLSMGLVYSIRSPMLRPTARARCVLSIAATTRLAFVAHVAPPPGSFNFGQILVREPSRYRRRRLAGPLGD